MTHPPTPSRKSLECIQGPLDMHILLHTHMHAHMGKQQGERGRRHGGSVSSRNWNQLYLSIRVLKDCSLSLKKPKKHTSALKVVHLLKKNICFQSASAPLADATATPAAARVEIGRGWAAPYQTRRDLPAQTRVDWAWRGACLISPSTSSTPTAGVSAATSRGRPPTVATSGRISVSLGLHPIAEVSYFQGSLSYGVSQRSYLSEFGSPPYSRGQLLPGVALLWC